MGIFHAGECSLKTPKYSTTEINLKQMGVAKILCSFSHEGSPGAEREKATHSET